MPAKAAGVTDRLRDTGDIVRLVNESGSKPGPRGLIKREFQTDPLPGISASM